MNYLQKMLTLNLVAFFFTVILFTPLQAKNYTIEPSNTQVTFQVNYLGVIGLLGKVETFKGNIDWDEDTQKLKKLEGKAEANSINAQNPKYSNRIESQKMLNTEKNKKIVLKSLSVTEKDGLFYAKGFLHFRGTSKEITVPVKVVKVAKSKNPKEDYLVFSSKFDINVKNWNIRVDEAIYSPTVNVSISGKAMNESWFF